MKKMLTAIALSLACIQYAKADLPNVCYATAEGGQFCTTDGLGKVQVFVYNAGWCPACNDEMDQLPAIYGQFRAEQVVFASLSGEGWDRGTQPDTTFLEAWKQQHNIPFVVAGKFGDFGEAFSPPGYIPFTVIVDQKGNVAESGNLGADEIASKVRTLLGSQE